MKWVISILLLLFIPPLVGAVGYLVVNLQGLAGGFGFEWGPGLPMFIGAVVCLMAYVICIVLAFSPPDNR